MMLRNATRRVGLTRSISCSATTLGRRHCERHDCSTPPNFAFPHGTDFGCKNTSPSFSPPRGDSGFYADAAASKYAALKRAVSHCAPKGAVEQLYKEVREAVIWADTTKRIWRECSEKPDSLPADPYEPLSKIVSEVKEGVIAASHRALRSQLKSPAPSHDAIVHARDVYEQAVIPQMSYERLVAVFSQTHPTPGGTSTSTDSSCKKEAKKDVNVSPDADDTSSDDDSSDDSCCEEYTDDDSDMSSDDEGDDSEEEYDDDMDTGLKVDLTENENKYQLKVDVPGVPKEDIEIDVDEKASEVTFTVKCSEELDEKDEDCTHIRERNWGTHERVIELPEDALLHSAKVSLKDGVLLFTCNKAKKARGRKLEIETL